jgi:hypothetical protein
MADKDHKEEVLIRIGIEVAKNGYEVCCSYQKKKKSLSQRAGWVPECYQEPDKYVAKNKKELIEQLNKVLPEDSKKEN